MKAVFLAVAVALVVGLVSADLKPPQVYVYTRHPPEKGKANQLICHCTNFHPPRIDLALKAEGRQLDDCQQSDMTFKEDWAYYTTMHKDIIYEEGKDYSCEVRHNDGPLKTYRLDPLM